MNAVIIDNVLAFSDLMNSDFIFTAAAEDDQITIRPETDLVLAAWPDWVRAPSRSNLDRCKVTLTRR